ncbi:hypothetical protein GCM10010358_39720 [Streptomyces minutiscleroticus]|uniref:Uncharacterized protein n=1 Tax=Streptomyces minutiscleroticus TaxID=68238 RepID=A0A918NMN9_9ACTN|nr:hypothetical protein GCM10010358_39720 [Streptomyces minutiscleroticus]
MPRAPQDRVPVIIRWDGVYDAEVPELPEPERITWAVHRWRLESVDGE